MKKRRPVTKFLLSTIIFLCTETIYSQNLVPKETISKILVESGMNSLRWSNYVSSIKLGKETQSPISYEEMALIYKNYSDTITYKQSKEYLYRNNIISFYNSLKYSNILFWPNTPSVDFLKFKNNENLLLFRGIFVDNIYNSRTLKDKDRANKCVKEYLSSIIKKIPPIKINNIRWYGFIISYGKKDFLDDSAFALEGESIVLILPINRITLFSDSQITLEELVNDSDIYIENLTDGFNKLY